MTPHASRCFKTLALSAALVATAMAAPAADAHTRGRISVWVGGPFWWPGYWGYPMVVERPVIVPPAEPLVVEPLAPQAHLWYYCREAQMYYPYVSTCPGGWQEVPATVTPATAAPAPAPAAASGAVPAAPARTAPAPVPPARAK